MEDALRVYYVSGNQFDAMTVLILVLMEDALRVPKDAAKLKSELS